MSNGVFILTLVMLAMGGLQLAALGLRIAGRRKPALWMAAANSGIALVLCLLFIFAQKPRQPWTAHLIALLGLHAASALAAGGALVARSAASWLFWPVWAWSFAMLSFLVYLRFFFHIF